MNNKKKLPQKELPVKIDIQRMNKALKSERFEIPNGLTKEEIRSFIIKKSTV